MTNKELKDFKGQPFISQIYWEDLDKDFLIRIMLVWQRQIRELGYAGYHAEIAKRYGPEVAREITEKASENFARVSIPLLMEAARVKPNNLGEAINVLQISLDSGTPSREAEKGNASDRTNDVNMKMLDENHFRSELARCVYADELFRQTEGLPEDMVNNILDDMCQNMDMRLFKLYLELALPGKNIEAWTSKKPSLKCRHDKPVCVIEAVAKE